MKAVVASGLGEGWSVEERPDLVPGTDLEVRRVDAAAGQLTVAIDGEERAIGERAAAGLYVLPIPA